MKTRQHILNILKLTIHSVSKRKHFKVKGLIVLFMSITSNDIQILEIIKLEEKYAPDKLSILIRVHKQQRKLEL